jgi:prepilin-type N-terminal cleavage/methylation domain-containing protein
MIRRRSRKGQRSAFTLVELLVVIAIIAVLVSLTAAAVMRVLGKIPEVQTRTDIGMMDQAMASFMADYGLQNPPPSMLLLSEDGSQYPKLMSNTATAALATQTVKFLQEWFGKSFNVYGKYDWNGNSTIDQPYTLYGQQCLVFYLGGIPTYTASGTIGMTGFSPNVAVSTANPMGPATPAVSGTQRKGPYFPFVTSRLVATAPFPTYLDAWQAKPTPNVYAFFSSRGKMNGYNPLDCAKLAFPYYEPLPSGQPSYTNNNRYQILSAGQDGIFGGQTNATAYGFPWNPASGATGHGADDQSNFSASLLGAGQH